MCGAGRGSNLGVARPVQLDRHPPPVDQDARVVRELERGQHVVAGVALEGPAEQDQLPVDRVAPLGRDAAEGRVGGSECDVQRNGSGRYAALHPGVEGTALLEAVELPEPEPDEDRGQDRDQHDRDDPPRSQEPARGHRAAG